MRSRALSWTLGSDSRIPCTAWDSIEQQVRGKARHSRVGEVRVVGAD